MRITQRINTVLFYIYQANGLFTVTCDGVIVATDQTFNQATRLWDLADYLRNVLDGGEGEE